MTANSNNVAGRCAGSADKHPAADNDIESKLHVLPLFATPVSNLVWPDSQQLNEQLLALIHQRAEQDKGLRRSNVGGWHSDLDLFAWPSRHIGRLEHRIRETVKRLFETFASRSDHPISQDYRLEGWANILRYGEYHSLHSHPNAFWSGVYYLNGNPQPQQDHPFSGKLELIDPRPGASLNYSEGTTLYGRFLVNPTPGQMVVFPGWLQHQVHPFFGNGQRVTIAFNVICGGQTDTSRPVQAPKRIL